MSQLEFRNSPVGRQVYVTGTSLAVWEVVMVARSYDLDPQRTATHLQWPLAQVDAALDYAARHSEEIEEALRQNDAMDFALLRQALPLTERLTPEELDALMDSIAEGSEGLPVPPIMDRETIYSDHD